MSYEDPGYFTMQDATVRLLTHPEPEWRGEVDCAFFQLAAGASPIRVWNYMRREGPAMYEEGGQDQAMTFLQDGVQSGAPPDDTALSNSSVTLQLMVNEERFQSHYYAFRSMTGIGDVEIYYEDTKGVYKPYVEEIKDGNTTRKETRWGLEHRAAGYRLFNGHVGTVGREVSVNDSIYPTIQIQFQNMRAFWIGADGQDMINSPRQKRVLGEKMIRRPNSLGDLTGTRYGPYSSPSDEPPYQPDFPEPDDVNPGFFIKKVRVDFKKKEDDATTEKKLRITDVNATGADAFLAGDTSVYEEDSTTYTWDASWQFFPLGMSGDDFSSIEDEKKRVEKYIENWLEYQARGVRSSDERTPLEATPPVMLFLVPQVKKTGVKPDVEDADLYAWYPKKEKDEDDEDSEKKPPRYEKKPNDIKNNRKTT